MPKFMLGVVLGLTVSAGLAVAQDWDPFNTRSQNPAMQRQLNEIERLQEQTLSEQRLHNLSDKWPC